MGGDHRGVVGGGVEKPRRLKHGVGRECRRWMKASWKIERSLKKCGEDEQRSRGGCRRRLAGGSWREVVERSDAMISN